MGLVVGALTIFIAVMVALCLASFALGLVLFGAIERHEKRHRPPF